MYNLQMGYSLTYLCSYFNSRLAFFIANYVGDFDGELSKIDMDEGKRTILIEVDDRLTFSVAIGVFSTY